MVIRSGGFPGIAKLAVGCLLIFSIVGLFIKVAARHNEWLWAALWQSLPVRHAWMNH